MDHLWCLSSMSSQQYSKRYLPPRPGESMRSSGYTTPRSRTNRSTKTTGLSIHQTILFQPYDMAIIIMSILNIICLYRVDVKRRLNAPYQKEQVHVSSASTHSDTFFMFRVNLWSCRRLSSRRSSPLQWSMSPTGFYRSLFCCSLITTHSCIILFREQRLENLDRQFQELEEHYKSVLEKVAAAWGIYLSREYVCPDYENPTH